MNRTPVPPTSQLGSTDSEPPVTSTHTRRFLGPGDTFVCAEPMILTTVIGSGVAICFFHGARRVAGLCHYNLPLGPQKTTYSGRFGDSAFRTVMQQLEALGCTAEGMTAKVFGGANISIRPSSGMTLGDENVALALNLLKKAGIPIVEQSVGGNKGRQITYRTDDGGVSVRML
jgi:chemotaxis protein CheD